MLQGLMKLKLLPETLLLAVILHYNIKKNQEMTKNKRGCWPLDSECQIYVVFWTILVLAIFCAANKWTEIGCVFPKFLKRVQAERVNETKVTSRNTFIYKLFILVSETES